MYKLLLAFFLISPVALLAQGRSDVSVQIKPQIGGDRMCLDARGDRDKDGIPVQVYTCHGSENQRWTIASSMDNRHAIIGVGGYCLDVRGSGSIANGTPAQLWRCHFGDNQRFSLQPDGRIKEVHSGKCLIAPAAKEETVVVLDTCKNTPGEVWTITKQ